MNIIRDFSVSSFSVSSSALTNFTQISKLITAKPVLRDHSKMKKWSYKTDGLLSQAHYSEKCTFGGMKGWSLNTGVL